MNKSEFVVVLPITSNNQIVMMKRHDYKNGSVYLDLPSDQLEKLESPNEAVKRILMQMGFRIERLRPIGKYKVHDAVVQEGSIFCAYGHIIDKSSGHLVKLTLAEVEQMLLRNEITTASSIIAFYQLLRSKQEMTK